MVCMKYLIAILALAGVIDSALALHVHMMDPGAAPPCAVSEHWDCGAVGHSKYSVFPPYSMDEFDDSGHIQGNKMHIPVATIGIIGYGFIAVFAIMEQMLLVLEVAQIGFLCAAFLSYIEAYILQKWCIYCVWSQALMTAILVLSAIAAFMGRRRREAY